MNQKCNCNMLDVIIVMRQSLDWGSISMEEFRIQSREFCKLIDRHPEQVNRSVDLWDRTFKTSFLAMRQEIKEIALQHFKEITDAHVIYNLEDIIDEDIREGFYIFIDDDDWIHPHISRYLNQVPDNQLADCIVWGSAAFGTPSQKIINKRKARGFCFTNNYAITGSYLVRSQKDFQSVFQHADANKTLDTDRMRIIQDYWSVTNKNPTSTVYLERVLKDDFSSSALKRAIEEYLQRCENLDAELDPSLAWAKPLMDKVIHIFSGLD